MSSLEVTKDGEILKPTKNSNSASALEERRVVKAVERVSNTSKRKTDAASTSNLLSQRSIFADDDDDVNDSDDNNNDDNQSVGGAGGEDSEEDGGGENRKKRRFDQEEEIDESGQNETVSLEKYRKLLKEVEELKKKLASKKQIQINYENPRQQKSPVAQQREENEVMKKYFISH